MTSGGLVREEYDHVDDASRGSPPSAVNMTVPGRESDTRVGGTRESSGAGPGASDYLCFVDRVRGGALPCHQGITVVADDLGISVGKVGVVGILPKEPAGAL